jgi:alanine dehydrogenase
LIIGIPREIKDYENRVALIPRSVSSLVMSGAKLLVEAQAGEKSGFSDDEYTSAGAKVANSASELYAGSDFVVKVKEIQVSKGEHSLIRPHQTILGFNHFESSRELTEAAVKSRATFISFEKVVDETGQTPVLMPMSKIAGTIAGIWAGFIHNFAFRHDKSVRMKAGSDGVRSKFVDGFDHIMNSNGRVNGELKRMLSVSDKMAVIFGGGTVGEMAARVCSALGAKITIIEKRESRRKYLQGLGLPKSSVIASADREILRSAHIIIGATYDKERTDIMMDENMLKDVSEVRKKIIIDVSVDQGGSFPYVDTSGKQSPSRTGTILSPAQADFFGNFFIRVPNIPSLVPRYASTAFSEIVADYLKDSLSGEFRPELENAVSIRNGKILDHAISKAHNLG